MKEKKLVVRPFRNEDVQPSSIDLHLGDEFLSFDNHSRGFIDTKEDVSSLMKKIVVKKNEPLLLHPQEFILGTSIEWLEIPNDLVGRLEGKSSLGRLGLIIHSTAGYFDPGFKGQATLEIYNLANLPITLYPGMKICQFSFVQMTGPAQFPYGHKKLKSHYLNQKGATGANTRSIWGRK